MKETDVYSELASIRSLMERSSKFISLSGLSGVMAGIYALVGSYFAYRILYKNPAALTEGNFDAYAPAIWPSLVVIALTVLILSVTTGLFLSSRQAKKEGQPFWNPVSKRLFAHMTLPLTTGGIFIVILLAQGNYHLLAPACLLFYGLSLVAGSQYTFSDVKWLGICEIVLGLLSAAIPGYGLLFWAFGFGILHILYGSIMHFKYKQ
ncbi:hypothetical protein IWX76_000154 [Pedobacter sp. CAN_A7]|uniref:hypothetical protein n=1 Tax=Pedobacter sp. CAN_A7 TaxID=2787722 RepID=UPI0018CB7D61